MVSITDLGFYFGARPLYKEANLHIKPKDRMALIGPNGQGKSTLLRLLVGEYLPDEGSISKSSDCTIGFLNQDLLSYQTDDSIRNVAMQAFERALIVHKEIDEILHKLETEYEESLIDKLGKLQEEFEHLDGYTMEAKANEVLEGLGFKTADLSRPLREFSGGWRMRVMLAKLLLQKPQLLLMDEPTNHLDLPSILWIEEYLSDYEGAIVVVSHDREFLNRLCNVTVEVAGGKLVYYSGNFDFYLQERDLRRDIQKASFDNQQAQIRQTERFIDAFRAKASKAKQVQSRVKALERMDVIDDVVEENARVNFKFTFKTPSGRHVVDLKNVTKHYDQKRILTNTSAQIERGQKIALVGANGKGKTTLLRIIAGMEQIGGERVIGHNVRESFFAQHQLEALHTESSMLDELKMMGSGKLEMELRSVLGCFLFTNDDVFKKIKVLSGGEKSRVALAKTLISEANFLLLDEPTNHLDMASVNILIQALQQYEGTFVVVSHDRHFVSEIANTIWYIEDEQVKVYPGTWKEYLDWNDRNRLHTHSQDKPIKKEVKPEPAPVFAAPKPISNAKEVNRLEADIERLETEIKALHNRLAEPSVYANKMEAERLQKDTSLKQKQLEEVMAAWERLV